MIGSLILKRQASFLFIVLLFLSSCKVTLVPEYSSSLEERIINVAKKNDLLYQDMLGKKEADRKYEYYIDRYNDIAAEINSMELENETRSNNTEMLEIIDNLKKAFNQYKGDHQRKIILPEGEIKVYQSQIRAFWRPLLIAEKGLKLAR